MWCVPGSPINIERFAPFRPFSVLYEFDGPKTFTVQDQAGELYLAHWCDEDGNAVRYIVVPATGDMVKQLEEGLATIRDALDQSCVWVLDVDHDGNVNSGCRVNLGDLPDEVLPRPGTELLASLENDRVSK